MVLTTGNKCEMSVGYATLYGDMCGGYNVLKDIYKTEVFRLARWRNQTVPGGALGPQGPRHPGAHHHASRRSAELRADQTDQDSLPPYEILDGILECLVEQEMPFEETCAPRATIPRRSSASNICSTSRNTSAARRRRA